MKSGGMTMPEMAGMHEIMLFKNTCAVKANTYGQLAHDERLKKLLEQDVAASKQQLRDVLYVLKQTKTME